MSKPNEPAEAEPEETEGEEGAKPRPKKSRKKLMILAAAGVLVLGGGGTAGVMLLGGGGSDGGKEAAHQEEAPSDKGGEGEGKGAFVDVPPMMVNLRSPDGGTHFLKVHVMLVPGPKGSAETLKVKLPVMLDAFQPFLRELRPEDLNGSAAVFRIKEELMVRTRDALGDGMVQDILIQDLVQQ